MKSLFFKLVLLTLLIVILVGGIGKSLIVHADSTQAIEEAKKVIVKIVGESEQGSGFIIEKKDNTYTVLTNWHVVNTKETYKIYTFDGKSYPATEKRQLKPADLAVIHFTSNQNYSVSKRGNSDLLKVAEKDLFLYGYPGDRTTPYFSETSLASILPKPEYNSKDVEVCPGTQIILGRKAPSGMSGSPLFNEQAEVVGIYCGGKENYDETYVIPINLAQKLIAGLPSQTISSTPTQTPKPSTTPTQTPKPSPSHRLSSQVWNPATINLERTLTGHSGYVESVAISPNGKYIVSGSGDTTIKVWNLVGGNLERTLTGHSDWVLSVAISPDGQYIVSGSGDTTIKVWNLVGGNLERTLTGHSDQVFSVAISPDGKYIVSGSGDNTIKVWNLATGNLERTLTGHSDWVLSVAISPDGKYIVSGSGDKTIKVWNLATGNLERTLTGDSDWVLSVAISPDGQYIVSGSRDQTVKVWNLATGNLERTLTGHSNVVFSVAISPDGKYSNLRPNRTH